MVLERIRRKMDSLILENLKVGSKRVSHFAVKGREMFTMVVILTAKKMGLGRLCGLTEPNTKVNTKTAFPTDMEYTGTPITKAPTKECGKTTKDTV